MIKNVDKSTHTHTHTHARTRAYARPRTYTCLFQRSTFGGIGLEESNYAAQFGMEFILQTFRLRIRLIFVINHIIN